MRGSTFAGALASFLVAAGCGDGRAGEADPPAPIARLADGFESGKLAGFWLPGHYGSGRYAPGAIAVSDAYARSGKRSARITVREGDVAQRGDDGQSLERAELDSGHLPLLGRDAWYGFSIRLPRQFPVVDNRLVISQVKQSDVEGSPLLGQRFRSGRHYLTIRPPGASGSGRKYPLPPLRLGQWVDMVYHVRYSSKADGRIEVWMDGQRVVSYEGPTADPKGADRFYHKVGLYRDRWKTPMMMYLDNYSVGNSLAEVDPARFDRKP